MLNMNCLYDVLNRIYVDAVIDPGAQRREGAALITMMNHLDHPESSIVLADRGYEG